MSTRDEDLLADLEMEIEQMRIKTTCKVCLHLASMNASAREALESALAGTLGERKLAEILTRNGYLTGKHSVSHHRKGHTP